MKNLKEQITEICKPIINKKQIDVLDAETDAISEQIDEEETDKEREMKDPFGLEPLIRKHKVIDAELKAIEAIDNVISDIIEKEPDKEYIEDHVFIERTVKEYKRLKRADLPLYKKYNGFDMSYYYRLDVIKGKQKCQLIKVYDSGDIEVSYLEAEKIFDIENVPCTEKEWHEIVGKLLTSLD